MHSTEKVFSIYFHNGRTLAFYLISRLIFFQRFLLTIYRAFCCCVCECERAWRSESVSKAKFLESQRKCWQTTNHQGETARPTAGIDSWGPPIFVYIASLFTDISPSSRPRRQPYFGLITTFDFGTRQQEIFGGDFAKYKILNIQQQQQATTRTALDGARTHTQ